MSTLPCTEHITFRTEGEMSDEHAIHSCNKCDQVGGGSCGWAVHGNGQIKQESGLPSIPKCKGGI